MGKHEGRAPTLKPTLELPYEKVAQNWNQSKILYLQIFK
jgi:hypothetical protein